MHFRILDSWRVMAALLVMVFHFLNYGPQSAVDATHRLLSLLPLMDMFLMISGVLIMERYGDRLLSERGAYPRFLLRRLIRFYPLYAVTLLYFIGIAVLVKLGYGGSDSPGRYDFSALPANILLVQGWGFTDRLTFNYVGWTLSAEWFCYLVLPVLAFVWRCGGLAGLALLVTGTVALLEIAVYAEIIPVSRWYKADTWGAYRAFADFSIGAFLARAARQVKLRLKSHLPVWIVFAVTLTAMWNGIPGYPALALLALSIFLALVTERANPEGSRYLRFLDGVSIASFSLYLIHPVIASLLLNIGWRRVLEPLDIIDFYAYLPFPIAVALLTSVLSARVFEPAAARWLQTRLPEGTPQRPRLGA